MATEVVNLSLIPRKPFPLHRYQLILLKYPLTGATYDTYNDVFKEYLVYQKLPEFRQPVLYRASPNSVLQSFHAVIDEAMLNAERLEKQLKVSRGTAHNLIRELKSLNLIRSSQDGYVIPQTVKDIYRQGRLGEYIRRQLTENDTAASILNGINSGTLKQINGLPSYLESQHQFIEASSKTWEIYSNNLKLWLLIVRLIEIDNDGILSVSSLRRGEIVESMGNLVEVVRQDRRRISDIFLPNISINKVEELILRIKSEGFESLDLNNHIKQVQDLKSGGWLIGSELLVDSIDDFRNQARNVLDSDRHRILWEAVQNRRALLPVFRELVEDRYTEETLKWKLKPLLNWAKSLVIIEDQRVVWAERRKKKKSLD